MSETATLARFDDGWELNGIGKDGMPLYRSVLKITFERPPLYGLTQLATDEDIANYAEPYKLFQKEQAARKPASEDGYPLAYWPVPNAAEFKMLADRDIVTVQQLAKLVSKKHELPPQLVELAERAKAMVELHKEVGKYEAIINGLTGERDALSEQLRETQLTIQNLEAQVNALRARTAA
jgi:vacuolar-type H+-ATPase subunit I/STV1